MGVERSCLVFGATGLVGKKLVSQLVENESYNSIDVANRRSQNYSSSKIKEHIIDFDRLENNRDLFQVDDVFICLGTTIKKAGSQEAFEKVDLDLPVKIAQLSKSGKVKTLVFISSLGADANSSNFYLRTKGRAEDEILKNGPENSYAVRPSMLFGDRKENRIGESIGKFFMKNLEFLMIGGLKKYRGIYDNQVARAMIIIALSQPKSTIIESEELKEIALKHE